MDSARFATSFCAGGLVIRALLVWFAFLTAVGSPRGAIAQDDLLQDFGLGPLDAIDDGSEPVELKASFKLAPDRSKGTLTVEATIKPGWHIYSVTQPKGGPIPTAIKVTERSDLLKLMSPFAATSPPQLSQNSFSPGVQIEEHYAAVSWLAPFDVVNPAAIESAELTVKVTGQKCLKEQCQRFDETLTAKFAGFLTDSEAQTPIAVAAIPRDAGQWRDYPMAAVLGLAFIAGLILNVMPCVLPVIGLKIMSFVNQAGANRGRVILLNVVFSLGIIGVFLVLATLAAFFQVGWGGLYQNVAFNVVMISVLFVFGLSFLGVWEIPIPGFSGSHGRGKGEKEGYIGTFLKGMLTTFLATPCSGPLLVPAVVWAIAQPVWLTYLVFGMMGLGMAAPYLIIGVFPVLVKALPRPGNWMVTFKQLMGFVLLGSVVFFLTSVDEKFEFSTLSMLVFLGAACWWIGHTSLAAELPEKVRAWTVGAFITVLGAFVSFYVMIPQHELDWQPYSKAGLEQLLDEGATVFVDFTADW